MNFELLPPYKTVEGGDILSVPSSYDMIQYKLDGCYIQVRTGSHGEFVGYAKSGNIKFTGGFDRGGNISQTPTGMPIISTLHGEYLFGTQWSKNRPDYGSIILFDATMYEGSDLTTLPYSTRLSRLRQHFSLAYTHHDNFSFRIVPTRKRSFFDSMWKDCTDRLYEGLVFKQSDAPYCHPTIKMKTDFELTLTCIGFIEGNGKHSGRLGALRCVNSEGTETNIGGGFTDEDREEIWRNQDLYLYQQLDATGKGLTSDGILRHPNFIRWK